MAGNGQTSAPALWCRADLMAVGAAQCFATLLGVVGWWTASGKSAFDAQITPSAVALLGVVGGFAGYAVWIARGRRRLDARIRYLLAQGAPSRTGIPAAPGSDRGSLLVSGPGLKRFHRPGCSLARTEGWTTAKRLAHEAAGRLPCGVCQP
jgi:hypothetical protein